MHASTLLVLLAYFSSGVFAAPALDEKTLLSNGQQAQLLNSEFADLELSDRCDNNEVACINGQFATCTDGKWDATPCPGDLICAALPQLNKVGTTVTCAAEDDALARIDASGANGGLVGDNANPANGTETTTATVTVTATAIVAPDATRIISPSEAAEIISSASASTTATATATESTSSVTPTSTATVVVTVVPSSSAASTTTTATSSASASAATSSTTAASSSSTSAASSTAAATTTSSSAAAPSASANPVLLQNGVDAQAQNRRFASLTFASPCRPNALGTNTACIEGQLATCNASGTWSGTQCPTAGTKCAAVPKRDIAGFSVGCFTDADALARFTAVGVPGGLTGA